MCQGRTCPCTVTPSGSLRSFVLRRSLLQRASPFGARQPWGLRAAGLCRRVFYRQRLPLGFRLCAFCCADYVAYKPPGSGVTGLTA
jgi:hypothetical protein